MKTLRQKTRERSAVSPPIWRSGNMIPGIKVDAGAKPLAGFPGETITEGLDGLRERLAEYYKAGCSIRGKWARGDRYRRRHTDHFMRSMPMPESARRRYAALCQEGEHRAHRGSPRC